MSERHDRGDEPEAMPHHNHSASNNSYDEETHLFEEFIHHPSETDTSIKSSVVENFKMSEAICNSTSFNSSDNGDNSIRFSEAVILESKSKLCTSVIGIMTESTDCIVGDLIKNSGEKTAEENKSPLNSRCNGYLLNEGDRMGELDHHSGQDLSDPGSKQLGADIPVITAGSLEASGLSGDSENAPLFLENSSTRSRQPSSLDELQDEYTTAHSRSNSSSRFTADDNAQDDATSTSYLATYDTISNITPDMYEVDLDESRSRSIGDIDCIGIQNSNDLTAPRDEIVKLRAEGCEIDITRNIDDMASEMSRGHCSGVYNDASICMPNDDEDDGVDLGVGEAVDRGRISYRDSSSPASNSCTSQTPALLSSSTSPYHNNNDASSLSSIATGSASTSSNTIDTISTRCSGLPVGSQTLDGTQHKLSSATRAISIDSTSFEEISLQSISTCEKINESGSAGGNEGTNWANLDGEGGGTGGVVGGEASVDGDQHQTNTRSGLAKFFTHGLFARKAGPAPDQPEQQQQTSGEAVLGWKLFGKVPPKQAPQKQPSEVLNDYKARTQPQTQSKGVAATSIAEFKPRSNKEVPSTTALILQGRPSELPAKDPEEEQRHREQYEEMVDTARRKEQKDVKLRKKRREQQIRHEEELSAAVKKWNNEILPNWNTARHLKRTHDLWWNGVPSSVRGKVWKLAIGNDLNVTAELYEICILRAKEKLKILRDPVPTASATSPSTGASSDSDSIASVTEFSGNREASVELIALDVSRTFPQLCIFQKRGPYHNLLQGLLGAYVCYRPDVGYVQGMSFLAAVLLLNMDVVDTFICFANLLNKPSNVAFFNLDEINMRAYFETYQVFFKENLPQLFAHFQTLHMNPDLYIIDWMYTMFAKSLPLDVTSRVWDVFFRDGEEFLFRTALGILRMYEDILLRLDFIHLAQFLTRLPETINGDELFRCIAHVRMLADKQRFEQVLARNRERAAAMPPATPPSSATSPQPPVTLSPVQPSRTAEPV